MDKTNKAGAASSAVIFAACICYIPAASGQARLPTDVELKAAYCLAVAGHLYKEHRSAYQTSLDLERKRVQDLAPEGTSERLVQDIKAGDLGYWARSREAQRLQAEASYSQVQRIDAYLRPRLQHLDSLPITAAMRQADRDLVRKLADSKACSATCPSDADPAKVDELFACLDQCEQKRGTPQPFKTCKSTDWLPF